MHLQKCENGHFYDADKFSSCPHCSNTGGNKKTVPASGMKSEMDVTLPNSGIIGEGLAGFGGEHNIMATQPDKQGFSIDFETAPPQEDEDGVTKAFFSTDKGVEPVVGWLVGISGTTYGKSFSLKTGKNYIGRYADRENDIAIEDDDSVSRHKHAIIIFEPKKRLFIAQPGESSSLFYVNDEVVLSAMQLKVRDIISIGNAKLMFIPFCDEQIGWDTLEV